MKITAIKTDKTQDRDVKLRGRLAKIWEHPNFPTAFAKISRRSPHVIKKGTTIFNEGDPLERLYCIVDGFVKLYRLSEEGRDTTVYLLGPNSVLGLRSLLSPDECARHNAEAITDIKVITVSHKEYFEGLTQHPDMIIDLLHAFIERLNYTERKLEGFIFTDTTARVANFLADCADRFGKKKNGEIHLPIELTHQRIAEFVGSFRETVTVALQHLKNEGSITLERGKVVITNSKKLKLYAEIGRKK